MCSRLKRRKHLTVLLCDTARRLALGLALASAKAAADVQHCDKGKENSSFWLETKKNEILWICWSCQRPRAATLPRLFTHHNMSTDKQQD